MTKLGLFFLGQFKKGKKYSVYLKDHYTNLFLVWGGHLQSSRDKRTKWRNKSLDEKHEDGVIPKHETLENDKSQSLSLDNDAAKDNRSKGSDIFFNVRMALEDEKRYNIQFKRAHFTRLQCSKYNERMRLPMVLHEMESLSLRQTKIILIFKMTLTTTYLLSIFFEYRYG